MTEEQIIDDILDEFDFAKVLHIMELLEWKWGGLEAAVPSLGQLRKCARGLMKSCIGHDQLTTATGGFHVQKATFDGLPYYSLKFVVTEWDNYN